MLLAALLAVSTVMSQTFTNVAPSGQTLYYKIVNGEAQVVHPEGNPYPYYTGPTWPNGDLEIPNSVTYNETTYTVTSIGEYAFVFCSNLTSVTIPNTVTVINNEAFYECRGLTTVTIPNSVTKIGGNAFCHCCGIKTLFIPNSVTSIGGGAFHWVKNIIYTGTATGSPWSANSLNGVIDGDFVYSDNTKQNLQSYIGNGGEVTIPNTVTYIDNYAFCGCRNVTSVTIPNTVTATGWGVFHACDGLTEITIPDSMINTGLGTFQDCYGLRTAIMGSSIKYIGSYAFKSCTSLTKVTLPDSVISIGQEAFDNCYSMDTLYCMAEMPPSLDYSAFDYTDFNANGGIVFVPYGTMADYQAASGWSNFDNYQEMCPTRRFVFANNNGQLLEYLVDCNNNSASVVGHEGECNGELVIPSSITVNGESYNVICIEDTAFMNDSTISSLSLPQSIHRIGKRAFYNCISLSSVYIGWGNSLDTIDHEAFMYCFGLNSFNLSYCRYLRYLGNAAFSHCNLSEVNFNTEISNIAEDSYSVSGRTMNPFRFNPSLNRITGPAPTYNNYYYFDNNTIINKARNEVVAAGNTARLPVGVPVYAIGDAAYSYTTVSKFIIPEGVTTIGDAVFFAGAVDSLYLPSTVTDMRSGNSLLGCDKLKYIEFAEGIQTLPAINTYWLGGRFDYRTHVSKPDPKEVVLPSTVTNIGEFTFGDSLELIVCRAIVPPSFTDDFYDFNSHVDDNLLTIIVPCQSVEAYRSANQWNRYNIVGEDCGTTTPTTEEHNIRTCTGQTLMFEVNNQTHTATVVGYVGQCEGGLTVPAWFSINDVRYTVTAIGPQAFQNCTGLTEVTLPITITLVDQEAFKGCSGLLKVDMK